MALPVPASTGLLGVGALLLIPVCRRTAVMQATEWLLHKHRTQLLTTGTRSCELDNTPGRTMRAADEAAVAMALP